jgi:Tfp pilus assembly protein PilX
MDWITFGIIGLVVVAVLAIGYFVVPYLQKKNIINEKNSETALQFIQLANMILNTIKFDSNTQDKAKLVFNIADIAVRYVEQTITDGDNVKKKGVAFETVRQILKQMNIEVDSNIETLIEFGIESAVNVLPKTNT